MNLRSTLPNIVKKAFEANLLESTNPAFPVSLRTIDGMAEFPRIWAIGSLQIIDRPLLGFFCSQRCPGDIILHTYDLIRMLRDAGVPMIGGFHTVMERDCLELLLRGKQPIVVCPARSISNMRIPGTWGVAIEDGRLLILSPFGKAHGRITASLAEKRNRMVALMGEEFFVPHASPQSQTERLCREIIAVGKKIYTFDSASNTHLVQSGFKPISTDNFHDYVQGVAGFN